MGGIPTQEAAAYLDYVARCRQATSDAIDNLAQRLVEERRHRVPRDLRPVTAEMVRQALAGLL